MQAETITFEGRTITVDWIGYPIVIETGVRCVSCGSRHENAKAVKLCFVIAKEQEEQVESDLRAEAAVERYFEDRGYDDARAQDEYEARHGVIGFIESWHMASPDTCPCDAH